MDVSGAAIKSLNYVCKRAKEFGYNGLQLTFPYQPFGSVFRLDRRVDRKVDALVEECGIENVSAHLPIAPLHTPEGVAEFKAGIDYVLERGVKIAVGHIFETEKKWLWESKIPIDYALSQKNLKEIFYQYKDEKLTIGLENLTGCIKRYRNPEYLEYLFGRYGNLVVGAWIDLAHATNSGLNAASLITRYRGREQLIGAHINDTGIINGSDKHCALGKGKTNLDEAMNALAGFEGTIVVEVDDKDVPASTTWLKNWFSADR